MATEAQEAPQETQDESKAVSMAKWIANSAIDGLSIGDYHPIVPAKKLAEEYLQDSSYANDEARIDALIKWEISKNFTSGFITSLGGLVTLPAGVAGALAMSWVIQARLVAAIAYIRGYDIESDRVRTAVLITLVADSMEEVLSKAGVQIANRVTKSLVMSIPRAVIKQINRIVGFKLLTKAGQTGVINLLKIVPIVGGVVGGSIDGATCYFVGNKAKEIFPKFDPSEKIPEDDAIEAEAELVN
jgi:hypothetical protein